MPIVFGDLDPQREQRSLDRLGEGLGIFMQLKQQKDAERDRERQQALSRFFDLAYRMPEVAAAAGPQIVKKYGEDIPELGGMVSYLQNQRQASDKIEQAGQKWMSQADRMRQENEESVQRQLLLAAPTSPFGMPNTQALQGAMAQSQVHPDTFLQRSAENLPPADRVAAGVWAKQRDFKAPDPQYQQRFDPLRDLPQTTRGVLASEKGWLPPETSKAARIGANMEEGAREGLRRDLDAEQSRRADRSAAISERGLDLRERGLDLRARESRGGGSKATLSDYKDARKFLADTESSLRDRVKAQQKAWDAEQKARKKEAWRARLEGKEAEEGDLGPRPEAPEELLPVNLNKMARKVVSEGLDPVAAEARMQEMVAQYQQLASEGVDQSKAVKRVLGESPKANFSDVRGGASGKAVVQPKSHATPGQPRDPKQFVSEGLSYLESLDAEKAAKVRAAVQGMDPLQAAAEMEELLRDLE